MSALCLHSCRCLYIPERKNPYNSFNENTWASGPWEPAPVGPTRVQKNCSDDVIEFVIGGWDRSTPKDIVQKDIDAMMRVFCPENREKINVIRPASYSRNVARGKLEMGCSIGDFWETCHVDDQILNNSAKIILHQERLNCL